MSIQKTVERYILERPSLRDALRNNLLNYSKLSRKIILEESFKQSDFDAVLIACRRLAYSLKRKPSYDKDIRSLLKETKIEIMNKMSVFIIDSRFPYDRNFLAFEKEVRESRSRANMIQGFKAITIITEEENKDLVHKYFKGFIIKEKKDLVQLVLKSPPALEDIPGVMSYLYSLFGEFGINIVETMSCWTDTMFIISRNDLEKALDVLKF
jgi:hypothetical protein